MHYLNVKSAGGPGFDHPRVHFFFCRGWLLFAGVQVEPRPLRIAAGGLEQVSIYYNTSGEAVLIILWLSCMRNGQEMHFDLVVNSRTCLSKNIIVDAVIECPVNPIHHLIPDHSGHTMSSEASPMSQNQDRCPATCLHLPKSSHPTSRHRMTDPQSYSHLHSAQSPFVTLFGFRSP